MPSFKALAVSFPDLQNSGHVKQHNVALLWDKSLKTPFYNALEEEIAAGEPEGRRGICQKVYTGKVFKDLILPKSA